MKKQIEQALVNIRIVIGNARMTFEEHRQLQGDMDMLAGELQSKEQKTDKKK